MPRLARAALALLALLVAPGPARAAPPAPVVIVVDASLGNAPYWTSKGRALVDAGRPDQALPFALDAVAFLEAHDPDKHAVPLAKALYLLAEIRELKGEYPQALAIYARVEQLYTKERGPDDLQVARALMGQGRAASSLGDYQRALPWSRRALAIAEKKLAPDDAALGDYVELLGEELDESGAHDEAAPLLERALSIYENARKVDPIRVADALHNLGARWALLGASDKAIELLTRSLRTREQALPTPGIDHAQTLEALSVLLAGKGRSRDALALDERAVSIYERGGGPVHPVLIVPLGNIALARLALHDPRGAETVYARALAIAERHATLVLATGSEREKLAFLSTVTPLADSFLASVLKRFPHDPGLARLALTAVLRTKGRALDAQVDSMGLLRRRMPPGAQRVLDDLRKAEARLSALVIGGAGRDPSASLADRAALEARIEALQAQVSEASASFRAGARPADVRAIQQGLPEDGALIELSAYVAEGALGATPVTRYAAFVLRATGDPEVFDLAHATTIDLSIKAFHDALEDPKRDDVTALGRAVDEVLLRPLRPALAGVRRIFLSPDRAANLIPFEALIDEDGRALIERYTFTYLASGRDVQRFTAGHAPSRHGPLILANPTFGDAPVAPSDRARGFALDALGRMRFRPLVGTAAEGATIAEVLPGATLLTGAEATKAALFASSGPSILHLATHGFFLPKEDPPALAGRPIGKVSRRFASPDVLLRSGLALAGANRAGDARAAGILTALEAAGLDLEGTRIVTLSACETGLGEIASGDGVHGLRRALTIAGAESLVMSLWKVDDAATRDLMIAYYRALRRGEGRSEAMRSVKLAMRREPRTAHPYAWASFIVSGDPSPIDGMTSDAPGGVEPRRPGCACRAAGEGDPRTPAPSFAIASVLAILARRRSRGDVVPRRAQAPHPLPRS